jgi:hypothetical protein
MAHFVHNEFLFAEAYLQQVLRERQDASAAGSLAETVREWRVEQDRSSAASLLDSYVGPVLDSMNFVRQDSRRHAGLAELLPSYGANKPVGLCLVVDPESTIGCTSKGMHWAEKLIRALRAAEAPWGILTDGETWRLYCAGELSPYDTYLEVRLGEAIDARDANTLRLFPAFFGAEAFAVDEDGQPQLEARRRASIKATQEIEKHLKAHVDEVLRMICMGFVRQEDKETFTEEERKTIFDNSVTLLYRIMFILYAESRRLLPVDYAAYRPHSLAVLTEKAVELHFAHDADKAGRDLWEHLRTLYVWIDEGHRRTPGEDFEIAEYDGELFSADQHPYLTDHWIANEYLAEALYHLTSMDDPRTPGQCHRIDYRDLSVRHLGSLYEAILEYKLYVAEVPMVARVSGDKVQFLPRSVAQPKQGDTPIPKGGVYFAQSPQERKQSGSYYTPEDVVDYIVTNTVDKGLEDLWQEFAPRQREMLEAIELAANDEERQRLRTFCDHETERFIREKVFTYRVLDPAMGSGHFLVNSLHHITNFVVAKLNETSWPNPLLDAAPITWRRRIVERCIYGVDINPLAAELSKLSLWLSSASVGRPLSFLRHHLKIGNSLLGARLSDLPSAPESGKRKVDSLLSLLVTSTLDSVIGKYRRISASDSDWITAVQEKKALEWQAERDLTRVQDIADVWLSAFYGNPVSEDAYARILSLATDAQSLEAWERIAQDEELIQQARALGEHAGFFHWELRFPDAVVDGRCCFNAVVANPPYVQTTPDLFTSRRYKTASCNDLYAWFLEVACERAGANGRTGAVVPLSLTFSRSFHTLREMLLTRWNQMSLACFEVRPDSIFGTPEEPNSQRTTVLQTSSLPGGRSVRATGLLRWLREERHGLFRHLQYADVTPLCSSKGIPKIGDQRLVTFYQRLIESPIRVRDLCTRLLSEGQQDTSAAEFLIVPRSAGYFISAFPVRIKRNKVLTLTFPDRSARDLAFVLLNSNVHFWYWFALGDGFLTNVEMTGSFPVPPLPREEVQHLAARLYDAMDDCVTCENRRGEAVPAYNFNKRMDILLEIDDWIVQHVAPDLDLPRDAFAQYKSNSFLRPLDLSALVNAPEEEEARDLWTQTAVIEWLRSGHSPDRPLTPVG